MAKIFNNPAMFKLSKETTKVSVSPTLLILLAVAASGLITTAILSERMARMELKLNTLIERSTVQSLKGPRM